MEMSKLPPKVEAVYRAIVVLFSKGADLNALTVSEITAEAGIGKGTAYEYFSNKEEMIAGALFYKMQGMCLQLYDKIKQADGFYGKMQLLLTCMEEQLAEVSCAYRVVYVLMGNSAISKKLKELMMDKTEDFFGINELFIRIVEESQDKYNLNEEGKAYLVLEILSKIVSYAMYLRDDMGQIPIKRVRMKQMICDEICRQAACLGNADTPNERIWQG